MNQREPTFRGGPGQRDVQAKAAKLRAAAAAAAGPEDLHDPSPSSPSPRPRRREPASKEPASKAARQKTAPPRAASARSSPKAVPQVAKGKSGERPPFAVPEQTEARPRRVRLTSLKNFTGVFLLPVAWVWTVSFIGLFSRATVHQRFWMTEDFWFFMLGVVLWLLAFSGGLYLRGEPPLLKWYVRIHEYTHAIWTWLSNGEVGEIKINDDHGHILTNKPTVLVTLAPYFYPLPCVVLIMFFGLFQFVYPLDQAPSLVFLGGSISAVAIFVLLMGMGWGFHFSYSIWMIRKGQSDLRMHGNFFSLVVIYLVNLMVVTLFLILMAPGVEWKVFARTLLANSEEFSEAAWTVLVHGFEALKSAAVSASH